MHQTDIMFMVIDNCDRNVRWFGASTDPAGRSAGQPPGVESSQPCVYSVLARPAQSAISLIRLYPLPCVPHIAVASIMRMKENKNEIVEPEWGTESVN